MNDIPMGDLENQLRTFMNIAAGEPLRRLDAETVRRQAVRRRVATLVAGATATVLVLCVGVVVALAATGPAPGPASHAGPPAGAPRFYIEQGQNQFGLPTKTVVRATVSGAVTGTVACPWPRAHAVITSIAPADDQEFFMACERFLGPIHGSPVAGSRLYRFRLTSAGRVDGYSLVRGGLLHGLSVGSLAVTPGGSQVAVSVAAGATRAVTPPEIIVIDTSTGAHGVWRGAGPVPGKIFYPAYDLSFTANGKELAFLSQPRCVKREGAPKCHVNGGEEVRAVSHPATGGQLASSRLLLRQSSVMSLAVGYINGAVISPDGRTVILAEVSWPFGYISIARASVATGKQVGVLYREHTGDGFSYRLFGSDPSRRFFLLVAGPARSGEAGLINGGIGDGRLFRLKPRGEDVYQEAW